MRNFFQIVDEPALFQMPGFIVIVYEAFTLWRQIFLDGRELAEDITPTWSVIRR